MTDCSEIQFCKKFDWFNACSECESNYSLKYTDSGIDYTSCIKSDIKNCYSAEEKNGSFECIYCNKGFILGDDNNCEEYKPPRCSQSFNFTKNEVFDKNDIVFGIYY